MDGNNRAIIIHNGSFNIQAGFGGDDAPTSVFRNVAGSVKDRFKVIVGMVDKTFIGDHVQPKRCFLNIRYPIKNGIIDNWDDMEKIWNYTFYEQLEVAPEEHNVMLTDNIFSSKSDKDKMTQIMFEKFNTPGMNISNSTLLSLYANGYQSGVVLDSGHNSTNVVPIYNGKIIQDSITTLPFGGNNITEYLCQLLNSRSHPPFYQTFKSSSEREIARDIKEKLGFISLDYDKEMGTDIHSGGTANNIYEFFEGYFITVGKDRYTCVESLFQPSLMSVESIGIAEAIHSTIMKCDIDKRLEFYKSIILSGGNTMFNTIKQRLAKELSLLAPDPNYKIKIVSHEERNNTSWLGGSTLSSLGSFQHQWIQKEEYFERGPNSTGGRPLF